MEKKCYDAALTEAKDMRNAQVVLFADNLTKTGNDPALLEYIRLRDAELLKSVLAGHVPELLVAGVGETFGHAPRAS